MYGMPSFTNELCKVHETSAPLSSYDANRQSKGFKWQKSWFHYSVWETGPKETGTFVSRDTVEN